MVQPIEKAIMTFSIDVANFRCFGADTGLSPAAQAAGPECQLVSRNQRDGNALNTVRTVRECVALGVSGIILEDQEWPKKCGHFEGKRVIPAEEQAAKLRAAADARGDDDLVIIGRTAARAPLGLGEA
ncbi:MAG: isocitrate lyase/phosphoenolpyruvate mutase family protein, partial [Proteobacteria bacterium]|nr:isocitrate lyase/phosphoenolpyruvate mutase family protein [Pseudomonadota bacterium]